MTEEQLRDVLARVVPEAPDSVADPVPVVRAARARRRAQAVGLAGVAAALVVGTVVGVRAVDPDDDTQVVDQPPASIADPYRTAPCPGLDSDWPNAAVADLDAVTAVRYCGRPVNGFDAASGPADALVDDVSVFAAAVRSLAPADPGRCAAIDVMPSDSRLLLLLADGSYVGVPAGMCQDAEVEGRVLDGNDLTANLLSALGGQRDAHAYDAGDDGAVACTLLPDISPVSPARERLVAATVCPQEGTDWTEQVLDASGVAALDGAWADAQPAAEEGVSCTPPDQAMPWIMARSDRGDLVRIDVDDCGSLAFQGYPTEWYTLGLTIDRLQEIPGIGRLGD